MPYDPAYDDDEGNRRPQDDLSGRRFTEFDCPECSANNPYDDGFGDGSEVRCFYCGEEFRVEVNESGRLRLRLI
ncbi:MAG TPA: hypothetical protein VMK12_22235 [Anaeromyxobacteraceae bacterium]|nr:hypothetical protein [Anaeromyxobacteraceae bacterium]